MTASVVFFYKKYTSDNDMQKKKKILKLFWQFIKK